MNGTKCSLQTAISIRGDVRGGSAWASTVLSASCEDSQQSLPKSPPGAHESQAAYERHRERRQARKHRHCHFFWCSGGCGWSVFHHYPRLSLFLLHLFLFLLKGVVCSLLVTRWGLGVFDVPVRLDVARADLNSMRVALGMPRCEHTKHPDVANLSTLEDRVNEATAVAQSLINANDAAIAAAAAATSQCAPCSLMQATVET